MFPFFIEKITLFTMQPRTPFPMEFRTPLFVSCFFIVLLCILVLLNAYMPTGILFPLFRNVSSRPNSSTPVHRKRK